MASMGKKTGHMLRRMSDAPTPGNRQRKSENQMGRLGNSAGLQVDDVKVRTKWKIEMKNYSWDPKWYENPEKETGEIYRRGSVLIREKLEHDYKWCKSC